MFEYKDQSLIMDPTSIFIFIQILWIVWYIVIAQDIYPGFLFRVVFNWHDDWEIYFRIVFFKE